MLGTDSSNIKCKYEGTCSGCEWLHLSAAEQARDKTNRVRDLWIRSGLPVDALDRLRFIAGPAFRTRDRVDLIVKSSNGRRAVGLYDFARQNIVDLNSCPQMSPPLEAWYLEFRKTIPNIEIGSFRLRVAPSGQRGVWLDLPNIEVKRHLDEGSWFRGLLEVAEVEIGQKRKKLKLINGHLKLTEPEFGKWFETYIGDDLAPLPLLTLIGGFSQPGFRVNRMLVREVIEMVRKTGAKQWMELGAGSGNFTFPLAHEVDSVKAIENDEMSVMALKNTAGKSLLNSKIDARILNFHKPSMELRDWLAASDGVLVDPPRSGLQGALDTLRLVPEQSLPTHFLYVSCFLESFIEDAKELHELGYRLTEIAIVDQFAQSSHFETVARFLRA